MTVFKTSQKCFVLLQISILRVCEKISENKLYQKLEKVGGRNQQFMANSPEEAGRNFADLIPHHDELYALNSNISFDGILDVCIENTLTKTVSISKKKIFFFVFQHCFI